MFASMLVLLVVIGCNGCCIGVFSTAVLLFDGCDAFVKALGQEDPYIRGSGYFWLWI